MDIARYMIGFPPEDAIIEQMTAEQVRDALHMAYCCDTEYHPDGDGYVDDVDSDPKYDMGFWRTGIRVSLV